MRRKSARNANKSPEKALKEIETPPPTAVKTRRSRRRKHTPSSKSSDTEDDEITRKQNKSNTTVDETPDTTTKSHTPTDDDDDGNNGDGNNDETSSSQEPMWKVTTSSDEHHGEIQKLKICLTRPTPDSPEKTKQQTPQRRSKSNSQTEDETTTSSEDKSSTTSTRRSTRTTTSRGSPFVDEGDEQKKGKGKSKGKHKTKIEQSPKLNEMNENQTMNIEISENVQVTQQSPTIDKPVDTVENDHDDVDVDNGESSSNVNENKADHVDDCDDKTKEKSIETAIPEEKIDKIDDNKNVTDDNDKKIDDDDDDDKPLSKIVEETIEKKDEESEKIIEQEQEKQENIQQEDKVEIKQDQQEDNVVKDSEIQKETEKITVEDSEVEKSTNVDSEIVDTSAECNKSEEPNKPEKVPEQETTEVMKTDNSTTTTTTSIVVSTKRKRLIRDRELVKEIETAQHEKQSKWCINIERLSTLIKIDLDAVQTISPTTIEFPEEPDLNIDTVVPESIKERRRSSQTIEKKYERKISIEQQKSDNINEESQEKSEQNDTIDENKSNIIAYNRKISIVDDTASKLKPPPSPAKNPLSQVLFITNLVRPFTIKQLKELLERTGKIIEDGFWTDRIKSKCYVQYETVEEAETTRNALHGVQWPIGNGKKLIIDYATVEDLENAKNPPVPSTPTVTVPEPIASKENLEPVDADLKGDDRKTKDVEKRKSDGPIREWDIGKRDVRRERSRSRDRNRKHRRSPTPVDDFISKKQKRLEEAAPQKLMDDLFLKTKATPSIYWQPLSPEEIATKQQQRLIRMEEHKRRLEESSRFRPRDGRGNFRRRYD